MATRVRQQTIRRKQRVSGDESETKDEVRSPHGAEGVKHGLDDLLDEIDEVLEENAEEFVKAYVQKGGE